MCCGGRLVVCKKFIYSEGVSEDGFTKHNHYSVLTTAEMTYDGDYDDASDEYMVYGGFLKNKYNTDYYAGGKN